MYELVASGGSGGLGAPPSAITMFELVASGGSGGLGAPPSAIYRYPFVETGFPILLRCENLGVPNSGADSNKVAA
jgi:hypothetical protein